MAKKSMVWLEDVRSKMIVPGRTAPLARAAFGVQLKKHGIKPVLVPYKATHRGYITQEEADKLVEHFYLLHWRKKQ